MQVGDNDVTSAFFDKAFRHGAADTAASASDDGDFVV